VCKIGSYVNNTWLNVNETWLTPLTLYAKWHIMHKRISDWRMGGDLMHTMWYMTNPKRAKVTIACKALITPYREPTDTRYDMSPGKCGTYMIWYYMIWYYTIWYDTIWYKSRQVWDSYDMIRYDMSPGKCGTAMICTWLTNRCALLYYAYAWRKIALKQWYEYVYLATLNMELRVVEEVIEWMNGWIEKELN